MFTIPRNNVIESDEGFSVEVLGRTGLLYTEGAKRIQIYSEFLTGPHGLVIYAHSIASWMPPYNDEVINEAQRVVIIENIKRAFLFQGYEIEVI